MDDVFAKEAQDAHEEVRTNRELDHLYGFAGILGSTSDVDTLLDDAIGPLLTMAGAERILIALVPNQGDQLSLVRHRGWPETPDYEVRSQAVAALGVEALGYRDVSLVPPAFHSPLHNVKGAVALVPMHAYGRQLGILILCRTGTAFGHSTLRLLNTAGRQLALAVENSRLFADLQTSYRRLVDAQEELIRNESLAALGGLAATMAHEIRNPLATIFSSLSQVRKHAQLRGDAATLLDIAEEEAIRLNRMVGGLLEFARPPVPRREESRPAEVIRQAIAATEKHVDFPRGVTIVFAPADEQQTADFDPTLLMRAAQHVINNAVAAVAPINGRVDIGIQAVPDQPAGMIVTVQDNGCGIPAEVRSRIFEPFFSTKPSGIGLGLSVVKRIVEDHGGSVEIESHPGTGTVVRLLFCDKRDRV